MGFVDSRRPIDAAPSRRPVPGRIGSSARVQPAKASSVPPPPPSATLIRPPEHAGGTWTFGPEIPLERRDTTRDLQRRRGDDIRTLSFMRTEFRFGLAARQFGIDARAALFVGEMPLGQRRVHRLRVQTYAAALPPLVFEDLTDLEPPFDTPERREAATDSEAVSALGQRLRRNPFVSERQFSASLSGGDLAAFVSFEDGHEDRVRQRADSAYAVGLVADAPAARAGLYTHPRLRRLFDRSGSGRLRIRFNGIGLVPLPLEVSDKAAAHFELSIAQALCGAGRRTATWEGRPVADYAAYLFEQHLLAAMMRRENELPPTASWREGFDPMNEDGLDWQPPEEDGDLEPGEEAAGAGPQR